MRVFKYNVTPNQTRAIYDLFVSVIASLFVYVYSVVFMQERGGWPILLSPLYILALNWLLGVYTRYKVGAGRTKALVLSSSIIISALFIILLSGKPELVVLWAVLIWGPLVLPRIFLNLETRVRTTFLTKAVKERGPVLVVGGGGYIGTHVVSLLLENNFHVRVLDRLMYGKEPLEEFMSHPRFELVEGDCTDIVKLVAALSGASAVVHLAGLVGDPACSVDSSFTRHTNVIATRMVKEVAISLGVNRFIFASSCSVYGTNDKEVNESSELNPVSLYAHTKIDSERELLLCPDENFLVTILRFATVFGHSRRPRFDLVANLFTAQGMIDGKITVTGEKQWRPFIHVKDLARAVVAVLKADPQAMRGQVFNVGDKRLNMTIGELAKRVQAIVAKERAVEVLVNNDLSDPRNYAVSFEKIRRVLGFEASVGLEEGVAEIVAEFKKGTYGNYKDPAYSNVQMTRRALPEFQDPLQASKLYGPLAEVTA